MPKTTPKEKEIQCLLKGLSYRLTQETIRQVNLLCPLRVELRREPENLHDQNAVAVYSLEKPWRNVKLGFVERGIAAELSHKLRDKEIEVTEVYLMDAEDVDGEGSLSIKFKKLK